MIRRITNPHKAGASPKASPAVETATAATDSAGSHSATASKIRALFDVLGPCIVRTCDGGAHVLSAEALKFVPFHEGLSA